ncbi:hypothetical protein KKD03_03405 [Patescibacteria group bacterium]|nr:hypothetical protein [Patescibacteria group bacterium]
MSNFEKIATFISFIFLCGLSILFVLYLRIEENSKKFPDVVVDTESNKPESAPLEDSNLLIENLNVRVEALSSSYSTLSKRIEELEDKYNNPNNIENSSTPVFQKQIIYIGSANTKENDWTDSGVEVNLNSSDYPSDIDAVFEVGLSVVGGEAWARLVNKTTGSIMAITEISHSSSTTTWKSSPAFKLFNGNNSYALQIRSTGGEVANFSGARIVLDKH